MRESAASEDPLSMVRQLARLLDDVLRIPGTTIRFGLDPIVNLVPIFGDATGVLMSCALIVVAIRIRVPKHVLAHMLVNIAIDALLGALPVLGQIADFVWKANTRNMALLERYAIQPRSTALISGYSVVGVLCIVVGIIGAAVGVGWYTIVLIASVLKLPVM
ncbi:MAG: DUF4112 domain-containing protein [Bacteroidota bacterium]|nr:DUF4112 domain-containing protein [Candidatus Kapabacteria bacterium]MDW8219173.1 DUF4112 domain-containing protein [Bacteroidota bacterium]